MPAPIALPETSRAAVVALDPDDPMRGHGFSHAVTLDGHRVKPLHRDVHAARQHARAVHAEHPPQAPRLF